MAWDRDVDNKSTYKPLTPEQREQLRRDHVEPRLQEVTYEINRQGRKQPELRDAPPARSPKITPTLH